MENLPPDVLVQIVEATGPRDRKHLHLVCRSLRAAVEGSAVSLNPLPLATGAELIHLCTSFPRATRLEVGIPNHLLMQVSEEYGQECLVKLNQTVPELQEGLLSLRFLTALSLNNYTIVAELPPAIFSMAFLEILGLTGCKMLKALPEEIVNLASLK